MDRKERRKRIDEALKEITVPYLRNIGFTGTYPHFRRIKNDRINLLTFQHFRSDPKFVVEIANCPVAGLVYQEIVEVAPNRITAHDMNLRFRLGSKKYKTDPSFDYSETYSNHDIFKMRANEIIELWGEAEEWWEKDPFNQRNFTL